MTSSTPLDFFFYFLCGEIYSKTVSRRRQQFSLLHNSNSLPPERDKLRKEEEDDRTRFVVSVFELFWTFVNIQCVAADWQFSGPLSQDDMASTTGMTVFVCLYQS